MAPLWNLRYGVCAKAHEKNRFPKLLVSKCMNTDTAGPERFRNFSSSYIRGAQAIIVGFDVTNQDTMNTCDFWISKIKEQEGLDCVVVAVGNKIDLVDEREVSTKGARAHFEEMDPPIPYFETSAKTGEGVNELFESVARMVLSRFNENTEKKEQEPRFDLKIEEAEEEGGGKCVIC